MPKSVVTLGRNTHFKGRRLSDSGAKAWLYREVLEARLGSIVKVDLQGEAFSFDIDERALQRAPGVRQLGPEIG